MLTGERVTLRPFRREDMETMCRFGNDVEVELLGGGDPPLPQTLEAWQRWYDEKIVAEAPKKEALNFAIEADGKMIGSCGLWRFNHTDRTCHLGIAIGDREYWSRGYGREAIGLLLQCGFRLHNFRKVCLNTSSDNVRAQRCYRACGFVEEGRLRQQLWRNGRYEDEVHMGIFADEWEKGQAA